MTIQEFCKRLSNLRLDKALGGTKPYKPVLILAVTILIAKGKVTEPRIFLDGGLKSAFHQLLHRLYGDKYSRADIRYPFRHLTRDGVWRLVPTTEGTKEIAALLSSGGKAREILKMIAFAELDSEVFHELTADMSAVHAVLSTILRSYPQVLPPHTGQVVFELLGSTEQSLDFQAPVSEMLTERALEEYLQQNWSKTSFSKEGVRLSNERDYGYPGRQFMTPVSSIDLLGFRPDAREWWVIELKRGRPSDAVVGQVSRYLGWIMEQRAPHGDTAVGAIVAREIDRKLRSAVLAHAGRLSLWSFDDELSLHREG